MFDFFKKKNRRDYKADAALMLAVFKSLGEDFNQIIKQVEDGLIVDSGKNEKGYIKFALHTRVLNEYENPKGRHFAIKGIQVSDINTGKAAELEITVAFGLLMGYSVHGTDALTPDLRSVKTNNYKISFFENSDYDDIEKFLSEEDKQCINPDDVFLVELEQGNYYHLRDIDDADGDFIGMDNKGKVYRITHDPNEIVLLEVTLSKFFEQE